MTQLEIHVYMYMHTVFYNKMSWGKISCSKQVVTQNIKEKLSIQKVKH